VTAPTLRRRRRALPLLIADRAGCFVASAAAREQTERRLRAAGRAGKLAGWLGEHGL
jgi:hypothetical protein